MVWMNPWSILSPIVHSSLYWWLIMWTTGAVVGIMFIVYIWRCTYFSTKYVSRQVMKVLLALPTLCLCYFSLVPFNFMLSVITYWSFLSPLHYIWWLIMKNLTNNKNQNVRRFIELNAWLHLRHPIYPSFSLALPHGFSPFHLFSGVLGLGFI